MFLINGKQKPRTNKKIPTPFIVILTGVSAVSGTEPTPSPMYACIRNQGSLQKRLVPELGQEKYKRSLDHFVEPDNQDVLKKDGVVERMQEAT